MGAGEGRRCFLMELFLSCSFVCGDIIGGGSLFGRETCPSLSFLVERDLGWVGE